MRIILASGSPRRKELLSTLIKDFEIIVSDFEETIDSSKPLEEEIKRLAYGKAKSVFTNNQDALVIGSDTIVTIDNKVLGKPKTNEHAIEMLRQLKQVAPILFRNMGPNCVQGPCPEGNMTRGKIVEIREKFKNL